LPGRHQAALIVAAALLLASAIPADVPSE